MHPHFEPPSAASTDRVHGGTAVRPWLHRYAVLVAVATLFLIVAGAMVTSTSSGLAVPDWPLTYGENPFTFPYSKWVGGIFYEHGHRLIASAVGLLTIGLAVWLWRVEPRRWLRRLGWLALAAVVVQGVLGGLTVIFMLPTPVSVLHACLAQTFFCITVAIAVFTSPRWISAPRPVNGGRTGSVPALAAVTTGVVFLQLILGAVMRHTESGLAVPDFPLAYGQVIPALGTDAVAEYNHHRRWELWMQPVTVEQIAYHLAHRVGAVLVAMAILGAAATALRRHGRLTELRWPAVAAVVLLAVQIGLGGWTVWSGRDPRVTSAHVAVGAATLAAAWVLTLYSYRCLHAPRPAEWPAALPQVAA